MAVGYRELIADGTLPTLVSKGLGFEICEREILVKSGDVEGFAKGLQFLLDKPYLYREMGKRGKEYSMERHSKERLMADMDRLYRSLL